MQVNDDFAAGAGLTPTEAARRAQIIDATIGVIAELGYSRTSFARIIEKAGLSSTRMISYHFENKNELIMATLMTLIDHHDRFIDERVEATSDRAVLLQSFLQAEISYLATHPQHGRALAEIAAHAGSEDDSRTFELIVHDLRFGRLERQLTQGQREGQFADFDAGIMARTIRHALEGLAQQLVADPGLDSQHYADEITKLFTRATGAA